MLCKNITKYLATRKLPSIVTSIPFVLRNMGILPKNIYIYDHFKKTSQFDIHEICIPF